jgi:hypothetical protein
MRIISVELLHFSSIAERSPTERPWFRSPATPKIEKEVVKWLEN